MGLRRVHSGFTLMELIIVILLLSILSFSFAKITGLSVLGYIDAKDRNQLSQSGKWLTERISRELREALPQSVRTASNGVVHCVEFMSIVNASYYLNLPASGSITSFDAVGFDLSFSPGLQIAVMPINPISTYSGSGTLATLAAITAVGNHSTITLAGATQFARRSPQNRFYILEPPTSICLNDTVGEVTQYSNYGINASQALPPAGGTNVLLGNHFSASGDVFRFQAGSLSRSGILQINFKLQNRNRNLSADSEAFEIYHEVHIRNVP